MALKVELRTPQKVYVSEVADSGHFFVQLATPEAYRLPDLSVEIQASVESNPVHVVPERGLQCYACSSADHAWYRAVVASAKGSSATVYFVDYGNTETVPAASVREALGRHFDSPYQAVCCSLSDFIPLGGKYSPAAVAALRQLLLNQEFAAVFRSRNSSRQHPSLPSLPCYHLTVLLGDPPLETSLTQQLVVGSLGHFSICAEDIHAGAKDDVIVCYVDSPGKFWVQRSKGQNDLQDVMDKLNSHQAHEVMGSLHPSGFYPGVACCALFSEDGMFYRSEIIRATQKSVEIRYVDYGNCETIDPSEVLSIPPQLVLSPAQAVQCCLDGIKPTLSSPSPGSQEAWSSEACTRFAELSESRDLQATFVSELTPEIFSIHLLETSSDSDLGQVLVDEGHALIAEPPTPTAAEPAPAELQYLDLNVGQTYKVIVSYTESPYVVWCQRTEYQTEFDHLVSGMALKYASPTQIPLLSNPSIDRACAVLYAYDQTWCRGVIQSVDKTSQTAEVLFVDFGNTESFKLSELKELLPEFLTVSAQAISFSMEGISPRGGGDDWSAKAISKFQEMTVEGGFLCKVVGEDQDGYPAAHLLDPTAGNKNIGHEMARIGLADGPVMAPKSSPRGATSGFSSNHLPQSSSHSSSRSGSQPGSQSGSHHSSQSGTPHRTQTYSQFHSQTQQKTSPFQSQKSSPFQSQKSSPFQSQKSSPGGSPYRSPKPPREAVTLSYTRPRIGSGQAYDVFVSQVVSPSDFYSQLQSSAINIDTLSTEIEKHCSSSEARKVTSPRPGMPILAKFSEDQCWYRALIKATPARDECTVSFVDFGNSETVKLSNVRELPPKLINLPAQAFRCTLFGFFADSSPEVTSLFMNLVLEDSIRCFVKSTSKDDELPLHSVELTTSKKVSVLEALAASKRKSTTPQRETAAVKKIPPLPRIPANSNVDVCISFVETPGKFYVQLTECYTTLDRLTEGLNQTYQNQSNRKATLPKPEVGAFCCTRFSEDRVWYRARVTALHGSEAEVLYIDYGNSERVKNSDLLVLDNQFAADPALAIPCTFEGLSPAVLSSREMGGRLSKRTLEKTLVAQFARPLSSLDDCIPVKIIDTSKPGSDVNVAESLQSGTGARQTGVEIPRQKLELGLPVACTVPFAVSPSEFYCQLVSEAEKFDELMNRMYAFYAEQNAGSEIREPSFGMFCAAPFSDSSWYRSKITKTTTSGHVTLFYADYGNIEEVPSPDIRLLESQFCHQPIQALRCSLNGVGPAGDSWSEEACSMFQEAVLEQEARVTFLQEAAGGYEVELQFREQDIAQKMTDAGLAVKKTAAATRRGEQLLVPGLQLRKSATYDVIVTAATSPLDFYCQVVDPEEKLDVLMDQIDHHCSTTSAPTNRSYKPGEFVLACFTEDQGWYRAAIATAPQGGNTVEVRYIDYGNAEEVGTSELRLMTPAFCQLPSQAVWCRLIGVEDYSLSEDALASLNDLLLNSKVQLRCVSMATADRYTVDLIRKEDGVSLISHAIEMGIVPAKVKSIKPHPPAQTPDQTPIVIPTAFPHVEPESFHDVVVVYGESPDGFYCQFSLNMEELDTLMSKMQEFYAANRKDPPAKCTKGSFLAAQFSEDQLWYRAQVCAVSADGVEVCFVDYGNREVVPGSRLQFLVPEFATLPSQAIPCSLAGVSPLGSSWSAVAIDSFLEIALAQSLVAQTGSAPESGRAFSFGDGQKLKLSLIDSSGEGELVAHKLIGVVVADSSPTTPSAQSPQATAATPPKSKMSENVIEAGSQHEAYVCHLVSPGVFWLQLAASEEALARLSNRLAAVYDSSEVESLALKEPETGMSCCAKFSEDQCWYRGVVRSVTSTGCLVHFVDYGNSETVALADVKFLKPEFLDLQVQAIKCSLLGCHPENQSDEDIIRFSDLVTEKLLLAEFVRGSAEQWEVKVDVAFALPELAPEKTEEAKEEAREPVEDSQALPAADPSVRPSGGVAQIPELQLTEGDTYDVFVTHTVLPTEFYCQIASDSEALETLMARVADYYNSSRSSTPAVQAGISCVAQYSGNNAWYRAKIVDVELDGAVTVYFVDYGNCEAVVSSNILTLHPDFASLPSQAICCSLTPNIGHPFTDEKLEEFFSLDFEQQFRMTITGHQQRLYFVDLVDMVGASVNEMLLSETELEEAIAVPGGQPSYIPLQYSVGASIDVYISFVASPTSFYCQPLKLAGELDAMMTELAVAVTTSPLGRLENIAPGDICLAQYSADSEWYRASVVGVPCEGKALVNFVDYGNSEVVDVDVMVPLPTAFLATKLQAIHCSVFQDIGAEIEWLEEKIEAFQGLFGEDQNYTITMTGRATDGRYVVDISSNGHAIDFSHLLEQEAGPVTVETPEEDVPIPSSSLFRPIPADDLLIPSAAQGVDLSMLSNDANEISMASVMAVKGSKTPSTEVETDSENGGEGEPLIRAPFKLSLAVQEVLEASIVFVQSPSMLYIQRTDCQGELDALAEEIEQYCASFPDKQFQPGFHPGDFVLAKYAVDDSWYRAEVVEVRADGTVEVSFIDYGNVESISPDKLIMCPEHFLDLPAQAIPCSLAHVPRRESWPSEYKELIDSLVEGKVLRVTVVLPASLGMRPTVTLEDLESATEISNQVLVKLQEECDLGASTLGDDVIIEEREELEGEIPDDGEPPTGDDITPNQGPPGLRKLSLPERQFEIGTSHEVFIASCQSPHSFLCQLASEAEVLDTITTQLAQTYAGGEETAELENLPEEGDYVCAQFSEDEQWYRSQVLGSEGNDLEVLYIDFGNSEVLPLTSLRVLGENLASYPPMAFECFLSGVESLTGDGQFDQTAADRMLELIGEGAVTMEIVSTDTAGHLGVALTSSEGVNIGASLIEAGLAAELLQTPLTTPSTATLQSSHSTEIPAAADTPKAAPFEVSIPESEEPIPIPGEVTVPEGTEESPVGVSLPESIPVVLPAATTALEYAMSYSEVTISSGTRFQVTVASVSSPDNFTCQTLTEGSEALVREIAAEGYSIGIDSLTVRAPTAGQPVCVCCSRDNTWCRAKITSVDQAPNTISVEYIDLGFSEVLTLEKVKYLKKVFASAHPPRALHCSLQPLTERDLGPSALETEDAWELVWPRSCSAHLAELTRGKEGVSIEVTETNEEGHFIVKLMDTSGEVDVDIREAIVAKLREPKALPLDNDTSDDEEFHDALDVESELQLDEAGAGRGGGTAEVDDEEPAVEQFQDASDVMEDIQQETPTAAVVGGDVATVVPLEDSASAESSVTAEDVAMTEPSVTAEGVAMTEPVVAEEDRTIAESPTPGKDSTITEPPDSLTVKPPAEDSTMAEPPETANGLTVKPPAEDSTMAEPPETANGLTVTPPAEDSTMAEPPKTADSLTVTSPAEDSTMAEPPETANGLTVKPPAEDSTMAEPPETANGLTVTPPAEDSTMAEPPKTADSLTVTSPAEDSTMAEPPETADSKPPAEDSTMAEPPETADGLTVKPPAEDSTMAEPPETADGLTVKPPAEDSTMAEPPETADGLTVKPPAEDSTMAEPPETANGLTVKPPAEDSTMAEPPETANGLTVKPPAEDSTMAEPPETANGLTVTPPAEDSTMAEPPKTADSLTVTSPAEDSTMAEPPETADSKPPAEDSTMAEPPETADGLTVKPPAEDSTMAEPPETADGLTVKPPAEDSTMAEPPETADGLTVKPPAEDSTMAEPPETADGLTVKPPAEDSTMAEPPETANGLTVKPPAEDSTMAEPPETADSKPPAEDSTMAEPPETADGLTVKPPAEDSTMAEPPETANGLTVKPPAEDSTMAEPPETANGLTVTPPAEDSTMAEPPKTADSLTVTSPAEDSTMAEPPETADSKPPAEDSTMAEPPETADGLTVKPPAEDSTMAEPPETADGLTVKPPAEDSTMAEPPETADGLTVKPPAEDSTMAEPPETANGLTVKPPAEDSTMAEPPETANGLTVKPPAEDSTMAEPPETANGLTVTPPAEDSTMAEPPKTADSLTVTSPAEDSTMAEPPETADSKPPAEDSTMAEPPETADGLTVKPPAEDSTMAEPPETADGLTVKPPAEDSTMAEPPETADGLTVKPPAEDSTMAEPPETADGLTVKPPAEDSTMAEPPETANGLTVKPPAEDSTMAEPPETANGLTVKPPAEDSTTAEPPETTNGLTVKPPAEDSTMAEPPETADGLTVKPPEDSVTAELHVPGEHLSTAESPSAHEDSIVAEPPTSDEDSTMADPDSTQQSEATAEDMTTAVVDEDSTVADHSLADIADSTQQECAELPTEPGEQFSSEPSVPESAQDVAAAGSGEGEEQPPDTGELSEVAAGGEKLETDTVAATEPSIERTPTEDAASEPLPPEPLPQEPPVAVEQTQDETTLTDISSDPVTGDTDVSVDSVTGDTDVSRDPVTGDTDVSSDPVTGDTDVSSDPVTCDTDVSSDPVTGDTDVSSDPVTGDTDVSSDPVTGDTDVSSDPVTGDTDVSSDPVTGDTDVSSDPVTGDTDVSSDPVTGDTDVSSDPVTGDTDRTPLPESVAIAPTEPSPERIEPKQAEQISDEFGSTSEQTPATEEEEAVPVMEREEGGVETVPVVNLEEGGVSHGTAAAALVSRQDDSSEEQREITASNESSETSVVSPELGIISPTASEQTSTSPSEQTADAPVDPQEHSPQQQPDAPSLIEDPLTVSLQEDS